ncbi:hypothetical protein JMJ35_000298 [Cladonia borealis]|uniref:Peptidase C14 caspase domain-containing protein n=1 Tax=Cladonia borealis TaxID=184061 RepID=A0AA39R957_9LECA|nr:hypothetical protein JMJ35_000298 [Cladonia borealis]
MSAVAGSVEYSMAQDPEPTKSPTNEPNSNHVSIEGAEHKTTQAPSDSSSEAFNTVGLVCHSPPLSQVDDRVNDEFDDSDEISKGTMEDGAASEYWERVSSAKNALWSRRTCFKKVVAVIVYWEAATRLERLREQADKLGRIFEDRFKFEVLVYKLPETVTHWDFIATLTPELDKVSNDQDSLFILYYGGHASMMEPTRPRTLGTHLWKKDTCPDSLRIMWSEAESALFTTGAICSKLFIFDCCHAGGIIDPTLKWETSCELLGACAADIKASALEISLFTTAFLEEVSNITYDIREPHSALCSTEKRTRYNLAEFPHYQDFIGRPSRSASTLIKKVGSPADGDDRPRTPSDMLAHLTAISDMVICISVTFNCTGEAFVGELEGVEEDWIRCFNFAPTECDDIIFKACHAAELNAFFDSDLNSCITIWSFPIWLWDAMAPLNGYQHIGIIRPQNLVLAGNDTQIGSAVPECSSNIPTGEVSLSPRSSKPDKLPPFQPTVSEGRSTDFATVASSHQLRERRNSC